MSEFHYDEYEENNMNEILRKTGCILLNAIPLYVAFLFVSPVLKYHRFNSGACM